LKNVRNVKSGVRARTRILEALESQPNDATKIALTSALSYGAAMHHLRLLKNEGIVHRHGRRPYHWAISGLGQKRL